ncbi:MAG: 3-oxoacyl-[acyl-carrier-protein] reductase [Candidatus Krumholzibacteria bacterium]|nr:3-oxoacyl-[acyl-carrier-protein] reductase [Candidatus Krumholzibacteria bacterium]
MKGIEGTTAIVTGAGRGIGRDICLALAGSGADTAVLDVDVEGAAQTAGLVEEAGRGALALRCDVSDAEDVQRCVREVLEWREQVHILVNNAGITRDNLLLRMSGEEWERVLRINLTGTFNMTRAVAKHMFRKRSGRIVNIASVIGQMGNAGQSNYAASKAGIIGFTKSAAKELAPRGVTVNAIAPGFIDTPMTAVLPEEVQDQMRRMIPLGRFGSGGDVANVVLFLVSDLGSYVTGQVVNCDGGMVMAR